MTQESNNRLDRIEAAVEANTNAIAQLMEGQQMLVQMFAREQEARSEFRQTVNQTLDRMESTQRQHGQEILSLQQQVTTLQQQVTTVQEQVATVQEQVATVQEQVATLQQQVAGILDYLFRQQGNGRQPPQS